jgi:hypothetical protein
MNIQTEKTHYKFMCQDSKTNTELGIRKNKKCLQHTNPQWKILTNQRYDSKNNKSDTDLTELNTEDILPKYCGMDPQAHLHHKYDSFHHNSSLPVEPRVWNQYVLVN